MFNFKKFTVGLLALGSLAACDNEQELVNYEKEEAPKQKVVKDSTQQNKESSFNSPKYHMSGGWTNDEFYIMIHGSSDIKGAGKYVLQKIPKKGKEKVVKHLQLTESTGNKLTAIIYSEDSNKTSFLTLEMNKERNEITITMPNEKPATYKETDIMPFEFNPEYVRGE
ncbi:hypothetical protein [Peribacillus sp. ACCC06369]|uniref:hypothetical protein n=1 Tax=Peribacillus sp. ACCC06369 TaxID=3055860 RepID=UPI0025A2898C|nr:hypothetical protein [Peribacillus sp. ACCC06369]MDM5360668.1 hypothetical protein [Peribacillus sp. ACCC06369]